MKLSKSAIYYQNNPEARAKKAKKDVSYMTSKKGLKYRAELKKVRSKLISKGVNLKGKDVSHTKNGFKLKSIKANRGSATDSVGDKKARGKKK